MKASAGGFMLPFSGISAFEALRWSLGWRGALPGTHARAYKKIKITPPRRTIERGCQTSFRGRGRRHAGGRAPTQRLRAKASRPDAIGAGQRERVEGASHINE